VPFLSWDNEADADNSLVAINATYGCPYVAANGYRMDRWDFVAESNTSEHWGIHEPQARLDKEVDDLMDVLMPGYEEHEEKPDEFYPPEEEGLSG